MNNNFKPNNYEHEVNNAIDNIIDYELNTGRKKLISKISDNINFKYNSFNIFLGKQGTGKTTSILKELMKLSTIKNDYHLIIYVSNNSSDDTFNKLKNYINIPIVKTDYQHLNQQFEQLIKLKDTYNKMIDGEAKQAKQVDPDSERGQIQKSDEILANLYINDFSKDRLHTFILMDDAAFVLKNENNPWFKWLCQLRHLNTTVALCLQIWKSINPSLKSQITSINIFKGYSRQQLNFIYQQIAVDVDFNEFMRMYNKLNTRQKLIIDCVEGEIRID